MLYQTLHPHSMDDIIVPENKKLIHDMLEWTHKVKFFDDQKTRGRPKKEDTIKTFNEKISCTLLCGPTGCGKTAILDTFIRMTNLEVVHLECDKYSRKSFDSVFTNIIESKNVNDVDIKKLIVFEEFDSIIDGEQLQFSDILKYIKSSYIPFVGTINSKHIIKLMDYKRYINIIHIHVPTFEQLHKYLSEKLEKDVDIDGYTSDVRNAIISLDYKSKKDSFSNDSLQAIYSLCNNGTSHGYSVNNVNITLHENYPYIDESCKSIKYLALSDIFHNDNLDNSYIKYLNDYGNISICNNIKLPHKYKFKSASLWTKMSNQAFKRKSIKEYIAKNNLNPSYDCVNSKTIQNLYDNGHDKHLYRW